MCFQKIILKTINCIRTLPLRQTAFNCRCRRRTNARLFGGAMRLPFAFVVFAVVAFGSIAGALPSVQAQNYPSRPVRVIVAFSAGGVADLQTRIVAAKLSELWQTSVVVDNRPGAGGNIAAAIAAKAPADGHTILTCNFATHGLNPAAYRKLPYDPLKDFTPVAMMGTAPSILAVHPSLPVRSVGELIAYTKANPGKLTMGSSAGGTSQYLSIELLKLMTGVDLIYVPYKGGAPALTDLLGGQVQSIVGALPTVIGFLPSGRLRAVAVTSIARSPQVPNIPTIAESGVPGFEVVGWNGLCTPVGAPPAVIAKISADTTRALNQPDTRQRLTEQGTDARPMTPEQFSDFMRAELAKWTKVAQAIGMKLD
jgi:tripartite-type tricarboxylate transporter receptor subunit TctC